MTRKRFLVLDRDGTLLEYRPYLSSPDDVRLLPGTGAALRRFQEMGLGLVVVTNQSGVGRGLFDAARLDLIHQRFREALEAEGVSLAAVYVCPHTPEDDCSCRKPKTGLLERAAQDNEFDPEDAFVIGDNACDIELGRRVGAKTFLVLSGCGEAILPEMRGRADYVVADLGEAVPIIERLLSLDYAGAAGA